MADTFSPEEQRTVMVLVRRRDIRPEMAMQRSVFALGYRYCLYDRGLPGQLDLVLPRLKLIMFVHGCFWHRHRGFSRTQMPKIRRAFSFKKFEQNVERDRRNQRVLCAPGWRVLLIWECQTEDFVKLMRRLAKVLGARAREEGQ